MTPPPDSNGIAGGVEPTRERLDEWLVRSCGVGLPHGEVTDLAGALHALAYVLRQIDSTSSYKVNIGQCISASSGIRWVLDYFARAALATTPDPTARTGAADHYRRALERIASCISHHPGDVVSIAQEALALPLPGEAS